MLDILAVSPLHQRKRLGRMLILNGLAVVDTNKARNYIEASHVGLELYLNHGWKVVDDITMDMDSYGGSGVVSEKILIRPSSGV